MKAKTYWSETLGRRVTVPDKQPDLAREIEERGRDGRLKDGWRTLAASGAGEVER